jgi:anti-sigma factor RsiW
MTELSDELLVAYVDGQLARKQTRAIDKVLEQDDVLDARVTALKHAHARLEAAFEAILAGEEAEISQVATPAASAGIVLALGLAVLGYGWPLTVPGMGSAPGAAAPQVELQVAPERAAGP